MSVSLPVARCLTSNTVGHGAVGHCGENVQVRVTTFPTCSPRTFWATVTVPDIWNVPLKLSGGRGRLGGRRAGRTPAARTPRR